MPRVYFARAMDGRSPADIRQEAATVREELDRSGFDMIDTYDPSSLRSFTSAKERAVRIVERDLSMLSRADGVLMDLSIPGRAYFGCSCELVYAFQQRIPVAAYLGSAVNEERPWLEYHASLTCESRKEAIAVLHELLGRPHGR